MPVFKSLLSIKMHVMAIISMLKSPLEGLLLPQIPAQILTLAPLLTSAYGSPTKKCFPHKTKLDTTPQTDLEQKISVFKP